jgi:NitT/TauT family transport system permease protein
VTNSTTTVARLNAPPLDARLTHAVSVPVRRRNKAPSRQLVIGLQVIVIAAFLSGWEWLPLVPGLNELPLLNRDYVSSPSLIASRTWDLLTGENSATIWQALGNTMQSTLIGLALGTIIGGAAGLVLSQNPFAAKVAQPYVALLNATPLIAFLPIIVVIFGISTTATSVAAGLLVVVLIFFNALEGGTSVRAEILSNTRLLGAGPAGTMFRVRLPYVIAWVCAVLPAAMSFALVGVVGTEFMVGVPGIGRQITIALSFADTTLTLSLAVILGVTGVILYAVLSFAQERVMHWWGK